MMAMFDLHRAVTSENAREHRDTLLGEGVRAAAKTHLGAGIGDHNL
jgi:hypothetical protein